MKLRLSRLARRKMAVAATTLILSVGAVTATWIVVSSHQPPAPPTKNLSAAPSDAYPLIHSLVANNHQDCLKHLVGTDIAGKKVTAKDVSKYEDSSIEAVAPDNGSLTLVLGCMGGNVHLLVKTSGGWKNIAAGQFDIPDCDMVKQYWSLRSLFAGGKCFINDKGDTAPVDP